MVTYNEIRDSFEKSLKDPFFKKVIKEDIVDVLEKPSVVIDYDTFFKVAPKLGLEVEKIKKQLPIIEKRFQAIVIFSADKKKGKVEIGGTLFVVSPKWIDTLRSEARDFFKPNVISDKDLLYLSNTHEIVHVLLSKAILNKLNKKYASLPLKERIKYILAEASMMEKDPALEAHVERLARLIDIKREKLKEVL